MRSRRPRRAGTSDGGRIIDSGTYAELIAVQERYSELFELQAAGYR